MHKLIWLLSSILLMLTATPALADAPEMADGLRASGKIYVVVATLAIIFAGIVIYLVYLDRKISKLEKRNTSEQL